MKASWTFFLLCLSGVFFFYLGEQHTMESFVRACLEHHLEEGAEGQGVAGKAL